MDTMNSVTGPYSRPNGSMQFFVRVFGFLGWFSHISFWASHQAHHRYTLHPPDDSEVVLPVKFTLKSYLRLSPSSMRADFSCA